MFINDVVKEIWKEQTYQYKKIYDEAMEKDEIALFEELKEKVKLHTKEINSYRSQELSVTMLFTTGCPHCNKKGTFSGCSFCDYCSTHIDGLAAINALKAQNEKLYAKLVRYSFDVAKGTNAQPSLAEVVTSYDALNPTEFTNEVYEEMFEKEPLFQSKPYRYEFETRATSINQERIEFWKKKFGKRVMLKIGVEVGDEFIRNHWLNKNINDQNIINAIKVIHENGWKSYANILVGIPGLTEEQSIGAFIETVKWLDDIGCDVIAFSPVLRKGRTVQNFLYEEMGDNTTLKEYGIAYEEQTGTPWIYTIFLAYYRLLKERPDLMNKTGFSVFNLPYHYEMLRPFYERHQMCTTATRITETLLQFRTNKDITQLDCMYNELQDDLGYQNYLEVCKKQEKTGDVKNTMYLVGREMARTLWPQTWEERIEALKNEL